MNIEQISPYLIAIFAAWLIAHAIKFVISLINKEKRSLRTHLFISGGMPSAHTASVIAMTTVIGLRDHIYSGLFGLAVLFSCITIYDAMKVRRSSGEQGEAIHKLIKEQKSKITPPRVYMGHSPREVIFGILLGLVIGIVVFLSTK
jgi:hypothetical protein